MPYQSPTFLRRPGPDTADRLDRDDSTVRSGGICQFCDSDYEVRTADAIEVPVVNFTAISMKASAARLKALSLRNTSAKSRCNTTSVILRADSAFDLRSTATLDRGMKLIPTSAETKRLVNSLESSSIETIGFKWRSWNSASSASRVRPSFGSSNGYCAMSASELTKRFV